MSKNNLTKYDDAIKYLANSPMFNLSLSSNELFHSNFLYWIWKSKPEAFKQIINGLVGDENFWATNCDDKNIEVRREYKNFDLSIVEVIKDAHSGEDRQENDKECKQEESDRGDYKADGIILFVLENKVKSIPYAKQLENYNEKITEHNEAILKKIIKKEKGAAKWEKKYNQEFEERKGNLTCSKVLLSLTDTFPDIELKYNNEFDGWKRRSYDNYLVLLQNVDIADYENICGDYRNYITCLNTLVKKWNNDSYSANEDTVFLDWLNKGSKDFNNVNTAEELRLHALYHNYNYAKLCCKLMNMLSGLQNVQYIRAQDDVMLIKGKDDKKKSKFKEYNDYFRDDNNILIGVGYGYSNQSPLLEVKVTKKINTPTVERLIYIIQVQKGAYEHGLIKEGSRKKVEDFITENKIYWVSEINIEGKDDLFEGDVNKDKYNGYNMTNSMVYKYRKIRQDAKTKDILTYIVEDVKALVDNLK